MSKFSKVKEWLKVQMKNKKFVITTIVFLVLLVAVVFGLTISFSGILGSVYDVDSIGKNIDKIKIGDSINYTANGYSDWEVLNINKEDNTIDIVSKTSVEDVTISGYEGFTNFHEILQNTANKYMDGKYAISARSVSQDDLTRIDASDYFWVTTKSETHLFNNVAESINFNYSSTRYIVPVVMLRVSDVSNFNVGDIYNYSLNGIDEWLILYKDNISISIIPTKPREGDLFTDDRCKDIASYVNSEIEKYRDNNVINVRAISSDDVEVLTEINYKEFFSGDLFTGNVFESDKDSYLYDGIVNNSVRYRYEVLVWNQWSDSWVTSSNSCGLITVYTGFRPVVTIKYSDESKEGKDATGKLEVGDYVKYSANAYNNWKVLNIDKEKNTIDIISGGIVKNLTLEGKEDYDNLDKILQDEVDKYKVGDNVVGARTVSAADFDDLKKMNDVLSVKYFLNNKNKYRLGDVANYSQDVAVMVYSVGVGYYDAASLEIKYDYASLEREYSPDTGLFMTMHLIGPHRYTAGLRPIITLKLSEVEESSDKEVVDNNSNLVEEQNRANQSSQGLVSNEKLDKDEKDDSDKKNVLDDPIGSIEDESNKTAQELRTLSESLASVEEKNKQLTTVAIINLVSTVCVGAFSAFGFFSIFRKFM